jgi:uncharacterized protein (DUF433 family)
MDKLRISTDPNVMMGKPVIAGTRIPVDLIIEKLAFGESFEQIIEAHPHLSEEQIRDALAYAAKVLRSDAIYQVSEI